MIRTQANTWFRLESVRHRINAFAEHDGLENVALKLLINRPHLLLVECLQHRQRSIDQVLNCFAGCRYRQKSNQFIRQVKGRLVDEKYKIVYNRHEELRAIGLIQYVGYR
ncbi:hypothetical protein WS45_20615 [Burkholderia sp. RF2-non_BP3]|nr:hypothetical protein WS45_20615 [Burkholderia sp. RF2-non_BP3]